MTTKAGNSSKFILWILGGVVGLCLCSCGRSFIRGRTVESSPAVHATITAREISTVTQTAEPIPVQVIAAQAIALATEIARPTNTSTPTNTPRPTATRTPTATATPDARVLNPENQHLYLFIPNYYTWHQARDYCASQGGYLATIGSASENDFVYQLVGSAYRSSWLGATDEIQEGTWVWVTGEPWNYTNWDEHEPNNLYSENYLCWSVQIQPGTWNDSPEGTGSFVCEWESVSQ